MPESGRLTARTPASEAQRWRAVDDYVESRLLEGDPVLQAALASDGLPKIAVSPAQGKFLHLLARIHGASRILEVGTLGGYSTIWLGRALPAGGRLVTLELEPVYARIAEANIARAGLSETVEIRVGPAIESLRELAEAGVEPFDLAFIDADKARTPDYFQAALGLCRPGGIIVADNVVRDGTLADADSDDPGTIGNRRFHDLLAAEPRVEATTLQTVGLKGYDGFTLVLIEP